MLNIAIYICGALVAVGGLLLGYLGVAGGFTNQRILALMILYVTLFFLLTGAFLYFYQNLRSQKPASNLSDRAYVVISKGYLAESPNTGNYPIATLEFENTGKTPAATCA
jgi:hypothetical protein